MALSQSIKKVLGMFALACLTGIAPVQADEGAGAGGGQAASSTAASSRPAATLPANQFAASSGPEITRAWITPTQPLAGSTITFTAEVSGSNIASVQVYYSVGTTIDLYPLATMTSNGNGTYTGTLALPSILPAGSYNQFRIVATDSSGANAYWPGVIVKKPLSNSSMADLAGSYNISDPSRSLSSYRGNAILNSDGTGKVREYLNGTLISPRYPETMDTQGYLPVQWSYDSNKGTFVFDWSLAGKLAGLGKFSGNITGDSSTFTLSGTWANGYSGKLTLQRTGN